MVLTTTEARRLTSAFDAKLIEMEHMLPSSGTNRGAIALQYWFFNWMTKQLDGKLKRVTKEAITSGVIFDHKKSPLPPQTQKLVYSDDTVHISVTVNAAATRVDWSSVVQELVDRKLVSQSEIDELVSAHTKENAPAHKFTSFLATDPVVE
jgi:hypothetical protein